MEFNLIDSIKILNRTPLVIAELLNGLSDEWITTNEGPSTWSPYDIVGHLIHGEKTDWIPRAEIILNDKLQNDLKGFEANLKTRDIDFLIRNINKPRKKISIIEILEKEGFETSVDYISGVYKFFSEKDLEIEFLVREMGKGQSDAYNGPSFGIRAEGLRHTGILIENNRTLEIKNIIITVPTPQAYLLQKIIINKKRKSKKEKDYLSIENLWENIISKKFPPHFVFFQYIFVRAIPEGGLSKSVIFLIFRGNCVCAWRDFSPPRPISAATRTRRCPSSDACRRNRSERQGYGRA